MTRRMKLIDGEMRQANSLGSPGKDLFIPHISRDEGEQMFLGPQVTQHRSDRAAAPSASTERLLLEPQFPQGTMRRSVDKQLNL